MVCYCRRTLCVRKRIVYSIRPEYISPHFVTLDLVTQAGTYVKEFIHGDLGRTRPNLGSLMGCEADILQLDVLAIDLDFPPRLATNLNFIQNSEEVSKKDITTTTTTTTNTQQHQDGTLMINQWWMARTDNIFNIFI